MFYCSEILKRKKKFGVVWYADQWGVPLNVDDVEASNFDWSWPGGTSRPSGTSRPDTGNEVPAKKASSPCIRQLCRAVKAGNEKEYRRTGYKAKATHNVDKVGRILTPPYRCSSQSVLTQGLG